MVEQPRSEPPMLHWGSCDPDKSHVTHLGRRSDRFSMFEENLQDSLNHHQINHSLNYTYIYIYIITHFLEGFFGKNPCLIRMTRDTILHFFLEFDSTAVPSG